MSVYRISSKNNDKIKHVKLLSASAKRRQTDGQFVLEGLRLCRDAALNNVKSKEVYFRQTTFDKYPDDMQIIIDSAQYAYIVDDDVFEKIRTTDSSQGVISVINISDVNIEHNLIPKGKYVACENVSDPANLGAISRTAEALGADGMILVGHCCDRFNPKALRASMGSLLRLPCVCFDDINSCVSTIKNVGIKLYASVVDSTAESINHIDFNPGSVVFIGNEANGLSDELINLCDYTFTIPITGKAESFNAAAAASIIIWELMKP